MLIDWGSALNLKEHDGEEDFCGTPYYMSPEQIRRQAIDGRSDLYSLSCAFYDLLCLKKVVPCIPSLDQLIEAVSSGFVDTVDAVSSPHQSYVPSEYKAIIHRGLSKKNREDRCTDSAEMLKRRRKIQSGYIDTICHRTFLKGNIFRYLRWLDKNPYPRVYLSYALVIVLVFGLVGLGFGLGRV